MTSFMTQSWHAIADAFSVPVILGLTLAILVAVMHLSSFIWYRTRQRGSRPLVIRLSERMDDGQRDVRQRALDGQLLAYLAADGHGEFVIAPGGGGRAAPGVSAEAFAPAEGLAGALLRFAFAREPAYIVDVTWPDHSPVTQRQAVVRISRAPGERVVTSGAFSGADDEDLIKVVGCFCISFFRQQPRVQRRTPRWERWSENISGYRAYRDGLRYQLDGMTNLPARLPMRIYQEALDSFHEAAGIEPGNLLVQLHRAALLEFTHKYDKAVDIYQKCNTLWPGHIETGYRLWNALKNLPSPSHDELLRHLATLREKLEFKKLTIQWLLTLRMWRWNSGERRYWGSWLEVRLPGRITKRAIYRNAIKVGELVTELASSLEKHEGDAQVANLVARFTKEVRGKGKVKATESCFARLLYPEQGHHAASSVTHNHAFHERTVSDVARIDPHYARERRKKIGWLAHFNAACFFSLAIKLEADQLPEDFNNNPEDWQDDCARAAIFELGILVRDPRNFLDLDWLRTDPDLEPLRRSRVGNEWLRFVGLIE